MATAKKTTDYKPTQAEKRRTMVAILWFLSPFIVLISTSVLQFMVRFAVTASETPGSGFITFVNILSLLLGIAGLLLIPIGIVMGVVTLTKK